MSLGQGPPVRGEYVPGEVLLLERPGAGAEGRDLAGAIAGARETGRLPSLGLRRVQLPPSVTVEDAVRRYAALYWVETAEPNYIVRAAIEPNDPVYSSGQSWYYDLLQAPAAWDIETGSRSVTIALIDSGTDLAHPDLDGNLWTNPDEIGGNGADDDGSGVIDDTRGAAFISAPSSGCSSPAANDPQDDHGHGTWVGGVAGAEANNSQGVAGATWAVSLMPVKALDCQARGTIADAAAAVDYAALQGADIANLSFVLAVRDSDGVCQEPSPPAALGAAIQEAQADHGVIFVGAAGNDGCPYVAYPAAFPEVIAVGASGGQSGPNARAGFSNWGPEIAVAAPGQDICSTALGSAYDCGLQGTSFATPLVSGLAALMLSRNDALDTAAVRTILRNTATDLPDGGATNWDGAGRINMGPALEQVRVRTFLPGTSRS